MGNSIYLYLTNSVELHSEVYAGEVLFGKLKSLYPLSKGLWNPKAELCYVDVVVQHSAGSGWLWAHHPLGHAIDK